MYNPKECIHWQTHWPKEYERFQKRMTKRGKANKVYIYRFDHQNKSQ